MAEWSKKPVTWIENRTLYISVVFTFHLPEVANEIRQCRLDYDRVVIGGPAVQLMPDFFKDMANVSIRKRTSIDVLAMHNQLACRTTVGCPNKCSFCAVPKIEGEFKELKNFKIKPIVLDNNLLASSQLHFEKVCEGLEKIGWCDFTQGLDCRLFTNYHAKKIKQIKYPIIRFACDSSKQYNAWSCAYDLCRKHKIAKDKIKTYVLIGYNSDPAECWERCKFIELHGVDPYPMWFHDLSALKHNEITEKQKALGWNKKEYLRIMQWFYRHRGVKNG